MTSTPPFRNNPTSSLAQSSVPARDSTETSSSISSDHTSHAFCQEISGNHLSITPCPPANPLSVSPSGSPYASSISSDHTFHGFSPREDEGFHEINPHEIQSSPPQLPAVVNRLIREEPTTVTKMESDATTGFADEGGSTGGGGGGGGVAQTGRQPLSMLRSVKRENTVKRAALGLRICEFVTCLISFSVMASDKNRGWALDSFNRYMEFRYSLSVCVLGFAYSVLQGFDIAHQMTAEMKNYGHQFRYYIDFTADQVLAYLLLSASSSAATRVSDWISNWGEDKFPAMASASVICSSRFSFFAPSAESVLLNFKSNNNPIC
ncbi:hypothetical protein Nepgr_025675 [Nepenthes gracilis]|uniref:CASP-like protein n=1 Tax=Nepenthes gracilis TaxID=150966 RepID=A0AAD3XZQ6_NEPGR|nr:hypothetical protein Nepgr_025675 [Nepenthes gracilis]